MTINNIATFFDLPAEVLDGRWHVLTIDGAEHEYRAARDGYGEGMYRHRSGHGSSNAVFHLSGNRDNFAAKVGYYLLGATHRSNARKVTREQAEAAGRAARVASHRPH